ncbi:hypothetical protein MYX84_11725 [Acidobacteria bacterium AH-259-O06]|nr:hypothetical protein [Acidobacteria bacterium AH-259-O06]
MRFQTPENLQEGVASARDWPPLIAQHDQSQCQSVVGSCNPPGRDEPPARPYEELMNNPG